MYNVDNCSGRGAPQARGSGARTEEAQVAVTDRQQKILDYIRRYLAENGYPPTIREIGKEVGITSTSVVNYHLIKLKTMGLLERDGQVSRGLKLPSRVVSFRIPLVGIIQAGRPIPVPNDLPVEMTDELDHIEVTGDITGRHEDIFALKVKGDSMIDALINEGDIVVMEYTQTADNGDMVAAWITDREETTLKRFYQENGRVRLQPANPTMEPFYFDADKVQIQGRVIAVIRNLS